MNYRINGVMLYENEDFFLMFPELVICKILPTLEFRDKIEKRVELIERRTDETGS